MSERDAQRTAFAARNGLAEGLSLLTQDASARRYYRAPGDQKPLLMDLGPDGAKTASAIISMTDWLAGLGLSVPAVRDCDADAGFMAIEDFGDDLFAEVIRKDHGQESTLYEAAIDVLAVVQQAKPLPGLPLYDRDFLNFELQICTDWYAPVPHVAFAELNESFSRVFNDLDPLCEVVVLRDFHAENLFWLPARKGIARVGLIDFQDARLGHPAYDFASFLSDARRDVSPALWPQLSARLAAATGRDEAALGLGAAVLGAQRNLKILGIVARLAIRDQRFGHLELLARVWRNLQRELTHPALSDVAKVVARHIPPPEAQHLACIHAWAAQ